MTQRRRQLVAASFTCLCSSVAGTGADHTCAVNTVNETTCWGRNEYGQTGSAVAQTDISMTPLSQIDGYAVLQLDVGPHSSCGVFYNAASGDVTDTQVKCWGENFGGIGYDTDLQSWTDSLASIVVESCSGADCPAPAILQVAVGGHHACVINDEREVKCWGQNSFGQLGYGDVSNRGGSQYLQYDVNAMGALPAVDLGTYQARTSTGAIDATPVTVGALQISAGAHHTCVVVANLETSLLTPSGTHRYVKCWGRNQYGQLGLGDVENRGDEAFEMGNNLSYVDLDATGRGWIPKRVACGRDHTCVVYENGKVTCWGSNELGALGSGQGGIDFTASLVRVGDQPDEMGANLLEVPLGTDPSGAELRAVAIAADYGRTCATLHNGTAKCWGTNGLHCGYDTTKGLNGAAYGNGNTETDGNRILGDEQDEMGDSLSILYWQDPDSVTANTSTLVVADVTMGACHTCALLLPATCSDGIQNQGEEMVDCGGSSDCEACPATAEQCDTTCFDRPPRSNPDYCLHSSYDTVEEGCAAQPVGFCDATCGECVPCPRAARPTSGKVQCFGSNYVSQLGFTAKRNPTDEAFGDDYDEKLFVSGRTALSAVSQLSCQAGAADECGCEDSFRGVGCADVVDPCDEDPCLFGARCYTYFAVVHPVSGKTTQRFECDCSTAEVNDVSGTRCEIDDAAPRMSCDATLPVLLESNFIANYTFLTQPLYSAYCDPGGSGTKFFPTSWTASDVPVCSDSTVTYWASDNVAIDTVTLTATSPTDLCSDTDFTSSDSAHAAFCASGLDTEFYFWGQPGSTATATATTTDEAGHVSTCELTLEPIDVTAPTMVCTDLDLTDFATVDAETGMRTWTSGAPLEYTDPDQFGACTGSDNLDGGIASVSVLAATQWAGDCGTVNDDVPFVTFVRDGESSFQSTFVTCGAVTYNTEDSTGRTAHTTGVQMFAQPEDAFGNSGGFVTFEVLLYDIDDPTVVCPTSTVVDTVANARSSGASCVFSPTLLSASDADSGVAQVVFSTSGAIVATWTVDDAGTCDGGSLIVESDFDTELQGLSSATTYSIDAVVSDASLVNGDTRHSTAVSCTGFDLQLTI